MLFSKFLERLYRVSRTLTINDRGNSTHPILMQQGFSGSGLNTSPFEGVLRGMTIGLLVVFLFLFQPLKTSAQDFTRTITKSARFASSSDAGNSFTLKNINGSVTIEAYDGDTIELTVDEQINGSSSEIARAKRELEYKLERRGNTILAYLDAPFITIKTRDDGEFHYCINRNDTDYQFIHDVHVKVPRGILLDASTINKGSLTISGSFKEVEANNVNGALDLSHLTSRTNAHTVNGDITAKYDRPPNKNSSYQTVNGTIKVFMPQELSADVYFKSMHGDLFTDFQNLERLKPEVQKSTHSDHSKVTYKVEEFMPIRIGRGGPKLHFQVLNGDVYIRKQS